MRSKQLALLIATIFALILSSCSSYMLDQGGFFSKFNRKQFKEAAALIKDKSEKTGKDQILFLLDRGAALFEAGLYKDAIEILTKAENLTEIKDGTSISEEVASVVTTDQLKTFYPLDYELIMINTYLALSYYMEGKYEDALVECRRINNLVYKLKSKGMKNFEESPLAWYISATIYEAQKKYNDALIDYKRIKELSPGFKQADLDIERMKKLMNHSKIDCPTCGDFVVILAWGQIPIKRPQRYNEMLPEFYTRTYYAGSLTVADSNGNDLGTTSEILNLEAVARKNLSERIDRILAKRILGIGTKVAIGYGVAKATKSDTLGILTGLLLHATTQADVRSWSTLPKTFGIARIRLPKGEHDLIFKGTQAIKQAVNLDNGSAKIVWIRVI